MTPTRQSLEIWGDFACFTNPLLKVERFSYPVMTPSAARAVFDAIYWKPKFRWQVTEIEVLEVPRYIGLLRNEVKKKLDSEKTILSWATGRAAPQPLLAGAGSDNGTPRQTMALKSVRYRIHAHARLWQEGPAERACVEAQFRRRAAAGQCAYQPYLGCREFPCFFQLLSLDEAALPTPNLAPYSQHIGWMLYDVFDLSKQNTNTAPASISVFDAHVKAGRLTVPAFDSPLVHKPSNAEDWNRA